MIETKIGADTGNAKTPKNLVVRSIVNGRTTFGEAETKTVQIQLSLIDISATNPRKKIVADSLEELAQSIKKHGVIQNIVVRPKSDGRYEIVSGERRYRASLLAKREAIPARIASLSDAQALEVQITENLHREDVHPLEEADSYQYLLDNVKAGNRRLTIAELAIRVGKNETYVHNRLQLTKLIGEAKDDLLADKLSLGHALELAKYSPEIQAEALPECYEESGFWDEDADEYVTRYNLLPVSDLKQYLNRNVLQRLQNAPFDLQDKRLHPAGRTCDKCEYRSGNAPTLFGDIAEADICTNKPCFEEKAAKHLSFARIAARQITRERLLEIASLYGGNKAAAAETEQNDGNTPGDAATAANGDAAEDRLTAAFKEFETIVAKDDYQAPLIRTSYYNGDGMLGYNSFVRLEEEKDFCPFAEKGVFGEGAETGENRWICRVKLCSQHFTQPSANLPTSYANYTASSSPAFASTADDTEKKAQRKQELFDMRVAEPVRQRVIKTSAERFSDDHWIWHDEFYKLLLMSRLFKLLRRDEDKNLRMICETLAVNYDELAGKGYSCGRSDESLWRQTEAFKSLPADKQSKLLFAMTICSFGENPFMGNFVSQDAVIKLAEKENLDYKLFDAEERVNQAAKKYKPQAKAYLKQVQMNDRTATKPLFYQNDVAQGQANSFSNVVSLEEKRNELKENDQSAEPQSAAQDEINESRSAA